MRLTKDPFVRWLAVLLLAFPTTIVTAACEAEGEVGTDSGGGGENEGGENEGEGGDTELEGEVETD